MTDDEVLAACAQPNNVRLGARTGKRIYATDSAGKHQDVTDQVTRLCGNGRVVMDGDAFTTVTVDPARYGLSA